MSDEVCTSPSSGVDSGTSEHQIAQLYHFQTSTPFETRLGNSEMNHSTESASKRRKGDDSGLDDTEPFEATLAESCPNMPNDPAPKLKRRAMELLLKGKKEEAAHLYDSWIKPLKDNEEFEMFVVEMLDDILSKAYLLEKNLKDQKEALRNRVLMLSQALVGLARPETDGSDTR